jgi:hypothetical protein
MKQLNVQLDLKLLAGLEMLVKQRGLRGKSEAVRVAVQEAVERLLRGQGSGLGLRSSLGCGLGVGKEVQKRRFKSEDDLWS